MPRIDPTARVADGARIADDVEIGPYCIVGPQVELKSGVRLQSHVSIAGDTVLGARAMVYPFVSLGTAPQSTAYRGEPTKLVIGDDCQFREGVTVSVGTVQGGGITTVGNGCFLMASSHIAHDCIVGNNVTFANNVALGGHVIIGDHVFIGGQSAVHQHNWVGEGAMIGGVDRRDQGCHSVRLRDGSDPGASRWPECDRIEAPRLFSFRFARIRRAFRMLFLGPGTFAERTKSTEITFAGDPLVGKILDFIRAKRRRQLMMAELEKADASDQI